MSEDQKERLETRLAYQERGQQELSDVVYRQELRIARLESALELLSERVAELAEALPDSPADDERPPHY